MKCKRTVYFGFFFHLLWDIFHLYTTIERTREFRIHPNWLVSVGLFYWCICISFFFGVFWLGSYWRVNVYVLRSRARDRRFRQHVYESCFNESFFPFALSFVLVYKFVWLSFLKLFKTLFYTILFLFYFTFILSFDRALAQSFACSFSRFVSLSSWQIWYPKVLLIFFSFVILSSSSFPLDCWGSAFAAIYLYIIIYRTKSKAEIFEKWL